PPLRVGFHPDTVHGRTRTETGRHCERTGNDMNMRVDGPIDIGVMYDFMERQDDCLYRTWDKKVRRAESFDGRRVIFEVSEAAEPDALVGEIWYDESEGVCVVRGCDVDCVGCVDS